MKNKPLFITLLFLTLGLGLLPSCKGGLGRPGTPDIVYDSIVARQYIPLFLVSDTTLPYSYVDISFTYPKKMKLRNRRSLTRLQQIFTGTFFGEVSYDTLAPRQAMIRYLETYTNEYREIGDMYKEEKAKLGERAPSWYWYWLQHSNTILFQDNALLSYAVEQNDYTGGAHGSYHITYTNIDLKKLVTLTEEDLFLPGYYKPLTEKILHQLTRKYQVEEPDSLLTHGFFTIDDIVPNNNFWLNDEGIHYSYNQYEIAPYAMGVIDVMIPYSELTDLLLPNGIVQRYIQSK